MPFRAVPSLRVTALLLLAGLVSATRAGADLIKVSPFLQQQSAQAAAPTENTNFEFRGSVELDGADHFRVVDVGRKAAAWMKVGDRDDNLGVTLKQYDPQNEMITLEQGGQVITLQLKAGKVAAGLGGGAPLPLPVMPAPVNQVVGANATPADEQKRLENVAAEIARRRALREQAARARAAAAGLNSDRPNPPR